MEKTPADAVVTVRNYYKSLPERMAAARARAGRPLTLAEKILFAHKTDLAAGLPERGQTTVYRVKGESAYDKQNDLAPNSAQPVAGLRDGR